MPKKSKAPELRFAASFDVLVTKREDNKIQFVRKTIATPKDLDRLYDQIREGTYLAISSLTPERQLLIAMAKHCGFLLPTSAKGKSKGST